MYICEEMTTFNIVLFPLLNENKGGGAPKDIHHKFLEAWANLVGQSHFLKLVFFPRKNMIPPKEKSPKPKVESKKTAFNVSLRSWVFH